MNLLEQFQKFREKANKHGYFVAKEPIEEMDGSHTYIYELGDWKMHDNFFGGEPYAGRVVYFYQEKPYWIYVYYGAIDPSVNNVDEVYAFLRKAMQQEKTQAVIERGPEQYKDNEWAYTNTSKGNVGQFSGKETISRNGKQIFYTDYIGGLVDQRKGF